jgi:hypothetical protein
MTVPRCLLAITLFAPAWLPAQEASPVKRLAVVQLGFDEPDGQALDSAAAGQSADVGKFVNQPVRVSSPFWNQSERRAVQFDGAKAQYIELADSPDLDRPDAVTLSLFCVNLVPENDAAFHGLFAKRGTNADGKPSTNYGINFTMQNDNAQFYIHDGAGYRVAAYSTKEMLPFRKLVHLTAAIAVGDAPGNDADHDADDVRFQVFVNGKPLTPKSVTNGFVDGTIAWTTDVVVSGLVNDVPLAIGRSESAGEYFSGVVDEFHVFPFALSAEQARQLFLEAAGSNVDELIQQDQQPLPAKPEIARINPPGLLIGKATQIVLAGKNLLPSPRVFVPVPGAEVELVSEPTADRLTAKVTLPAEATPAIVPVFVQTEHGLSGGELVAVDELPLRNIQTVSAQEPARLPAAYWGTLQGGNVVRLEFSGKAGQRFVADVELRRLGGQAQPVLELKSPLGTPLAIAWGHAWLGGDARIEAVLPSDGQYSIELHDLVYRASGGANSFRLKVGDLRLLDLPFPLAALPGPLTIEPVGTGFSAETRWTALFQPIASASASPLPLPAGERVPGPRPLVMNSTAAAELVETEISGGNLPTIDATWAGSKLPVGISGRLRNRHERDRYLLQVAPGQKLRLTLQSKSMGSPVDGEIAVLAHPAGNPLAMTSDQPSDTDPRLDFTVPAGMNQVQVAVRDLFGRGGDLAVYRLEVAPAEFPAFDLSLNLASVSLPADGSALVILTLNRVSYTGPVALQVAGDDALTISPAEIPAGVSGAVWCRLQRTNASSPDVSLVRIVGSSVGAEPIVSRQASLNLMAPAYRQTLAAGVTAPTGLSVELQQPPAVLYRGVTQRLPLTIARVSDRPGGSAPVRFNSQSTEAVRPRQPGNPGAGNFPLVAVVPGQLAASDAAQFELAVQTPLEVVEKSLQMAIIAEAVPHAYSDRVLATAHAVPFRAAIENAVSPKLEDATLKVLAESEHAVKGTLQRTTGFSDPVEVTLTGLPADYHVTPAKVAGDQNEFQIVVKAPAVENEKALENIKLRVTSQGSAIANEAPVALRAVPKP